MKQAYQYKKSTFTVTYLLAYALFCLDILNTDGQAHHLADSYSQRLNRYGGSCEVSTSTCSKAGV
jgi:hypothetical protein